MDQLEGLPNQAVFAKYKNSYFIETGTYCGDGLQMALDVGFLSIDSIELSQVDYELCKNRFATSPHVH